MIPVDWLLLAICVLLIVACGLFGAAEYSLVAVDRAQIEAAARAGDKQAHGVSKALRRLSTQLSGAQVGITITNLVIGFLAEPSIAHLLRGPMRAIGISGSTLTSVCVALGMILATIATMLFGELIPKKIAIARPEGTARHTQAMLRAFSQVVRGPIWLLNGSANALVRLGGVEPQEELRSARTTEELAALAEHSASEGTLDTETATLVQRSVAFGPRTAGEIMTPRVQMEAVDANASILDVIERSAATGFSKFPVTKGSNDNIVGAVHVKQVVTIPRSDRETTLVRQIMTEIPVVPETLRLDPLLTLLRSSGLQMAAVSDEYGGTAGIVTLEDVVEEIVGEIADEHDPRGSRLRRRPDGSWLISGLLRPDEVAETTGIDLPEDESYDTVAGLLVRELGHIPERGEEALVRLADEFGEDDEVHPRYAVLRVEAMDALRVDRLSLRLVEVDA